MNCKEEFLKHFFLSHYSVSKYLVLRNRPFEGLFVHAAWFRVCSLAIFELAKGLGRLFKLHTYT